VVYFPGSVAEVKMAIRNSVGILVDPEQQSIKLLTPQREVRSEFDTVKRQNIGEYMLAFRIPVDAKPGMWTVAWEALHNNEGASVNIPVQVRKEMSSVYGQVKLERTLLIADMTMTRLIYPSNEKLPASVKGVLPAAAQTMWRKAFNAAYHHYNCEDTARKVAWSAVKKKYEKKGRMWVARRKK